MCFALTLWLKFNRRLRGYDLLRVINLLKIKGLSCGFEDGKPEVAVGIDAISACRDQRNGKMDEIHIPPRDEHVGFSAHGSVDGVLRQTRRENAVFRRRGYTSN